jgi:DnaJ-class molecular chaperone
MAKNYYIVLRVSRAESPRGIQDAFRELAKKYHPDRIGPQGTRIFQEILEAYQALPIQRKESSTTRSFTRPRPKKKSGPNPLGYAGRAPNH